MKTTLAILFVVVACGVASLRADDAATKPANQSNADFVRQRVAQIDLNVELRQYEKVSNQLAEAGLDLEVAQNLATTEQEKKNCELMGKKIQVLQRAKLILASQLEEMGREMDAQAKAVAGK